MKIFKFPVRVYYSDTDAEGFVYHTNYLNFAEHARTEALREVYESNQESMLKEGIGFVVASININYLAPAKLDDMLCVYTSVQDVRTFSCVFHQEVKRDEELIAVLDVKVGCVSMEKNRPVKLPPEIMQAFI